MAEILASIIPHNYEPAQGMGAPDEWSVCDIWREDGRVWVVLHHELYGVLHAIEMESEDGAA